MKYICIKKLSLSGKQYYPGDVIPDNAFLDGSEAKLTKSGYVTEVGNEPTFDPAGGIAGEAEPVISVVFTDGDMNTAYPIDTEQLQIIADTMQKSASEAVATIEELADESPLVFILKVDSRKAVREAAQKRLSALYSIPGATGQSATGGTQDGAESKNEQISATATE